MSDPTERSEGGEQSEHAPDQASQAPTPSIHPSEEVTVAATPSAMPKKKKKKRKKPDDAPVAPDPAVGADGRERPAFVLDFPRDPALDKLVRAFEVGNYAYVRENAAELAEKAKDARVRAAAAELARRIEPDPLLKILLALSVLLLFALTIWAYKTHGN